MEYKYFSVFIFGFFLQNVQNSLAQEKPAYHLPENYQFDYEVVQLTKSKGTGSNVEANPDTTYYYYTSSGDYAGMRVSGGKRGKTSGLFVFTRDGDWIIFDDDKKTITIINMRNMIKDLAGMGKAMSRDSLSAKSKDKEDPRQIQSEKTGNTKMISGYTAEEYKITKKDGHSMRVWYAKVDFNTQLYYMLGMGGGASRSNMGNQNSFLQTIAQPNTLLAEIDSDHADNNGKSVGMYTQTIASKKTGKATIGYQVNNYSNMGMKEMIQAETKKNSAEQPH